MWDDWRFQIAVWGYACLTGPKKDMTLANLRGWLMSGQLALMCEGWPQDGWWD